MKRFSNTLLCLLLALLPTMGVAQSNIRKSFAELTKNINGKETHCTQKDDAGKQLLSQTDIYSFTASASGKELLRKAMDALRTDTLKAYSVLSASKGEMPLQFLGKGDMSIKIGTSYDHYLCNLYDDTNHKGFRYAYAIEWNYEKAGDIDVRVVSLYDKKPTHYQGRSLATFGRVMQTLGPDDSLTISKHAFDKIVRTAEASNKALKENKKLDASQWTTQLGSLFALLDVPKLETKHIEIVARIYTLCKSQPEDLRKAERKDAISRIDVLKGKVDDEPVLIDILDAARDCLQHQP